MKSRVTVNSGWGAGSEEKPSVSVKIACTVCQRPDTEVKLFSHPILRVAICAACLREFNETPVRRTSLQTNTDFCKVTRLPMVRL